VLLRPLTIDGAWIFESRVHGDDRGYIREWFNSAVVKETLGREFLVAQTNLSKSKRGVVRGIHFSTAPVGQAKWITCANGALWDVVVDIRPSSPTFKQWEAHKLRAGDNRSIFISEGLGHAFVSLENETVISYLLSSQYSPLDEHAINPLDPEINITWPKLSLTFSEKDAAAPSLRDFLSRF
jgi:dTDP-4-dehydrorhamnose 3,5-epimerase